MFVTAEKVAMYVPNYRDLFTQLWCCIMIRNSSKSHKYKNSMFSQAESTSTTRSCARGTLSGIANKPGAE